MDLTISRQPAGLLLTMNGRLGSFEAQELQAALDKHLNASERYLILDFKSVDYISSAGLRVLLASHRTLRKRCGQVVLCGLQTYCMDVLDIAGFSSEFPIFSDLEAAAGYLQQMASDELNRAHYDELETIKIPGASLTIVPGSDQACMVKVMGDVKDVLYSRVTPGHIRSKRFSETEYSIGLGGMGNQMDDYLGIMGEMMTIGGTMVWLPTDGHDTPDFLIPRQDRGQINLRTGFNVALEGQFNESILFSAENEQDWDIQSIYRALFDLARQRRPDFRGIIGLAMRAQMPAVYGSGIKHSPVIERRPPDGAMVTAAQHTSEWFDFDDVPRYENVTGLICGLGADLNADLASYNQDLLNCVFYLNPANVGSSSEMLHNHAVLFEPLAMPDRPVNLDKEIRHVVEKGEFVDMRHLLDRSTVSQAFIGICYIQDFINDIEMVE